MLINTHGDIQKKSNQRLSVILKLKGLNVSSNLLLLLYKSIVCSASPHALFSMLLKYAHNQKPEHPHKNNLYCLKGYRPLHSQSHPVKGQSHHTQPLHQYFTLLPSGSRHTLSGTTEHGLKTVSYPQPSQY